MKCDKCGFEHNSRSVCPKCGARVVYVNEEYLARKRAYEEALKEGKTSDSKLPPGIMFSTKEEHDERKGNQDHNTKEEKGMPFSVGLSFAVKIWGRFTTWVKSKKKKRGANNPVVRELKFDDKPETLDESKLVLAHKVFKDHRKPIVIAIISVIILAIALVTIMQIISRIDRSRVIIYDGKQLYYLDDESHPIVQTAEATIVYSEATHQLLVDSSQIFIIDGNKCIAYDADDAKIIAYNSNLNLVVYVENSRLMLISQGKIVATDVMLSDGYMPSGAVATSGDAFAIIACKMAADYEYNEYTLYYGDSKGNCEVISVSQNEPQLYYVDASKVAYLTMELADYGAIIGKKLMVYKADGIISLVENVDRISPRENGAYLTDTLDNLHWIDYKDMSVNTIAKEVSETWNVSEGIVYRQEDILFYSNMNINKALMHAPNSSVVFYYDEDDAEMYYRSMDSLYVIREWSEDTIGDKICSIRGDTVPQFISAAKDYFVIDLEDNLLRINGVASKIASKVANVYEIENYDGYLYVADNRLILNNLKNRVKMDSPINANPNVCVYSHQNVYWLDDNGILHLNKKDSSNNVGYCVFMTVQAR